MVRRLVAELVADVRAELGEGPVWDDRTGRLLWVDILARRILVTDVTSGQTEWFQTPLPVGSIALRERGGLVAALEDGFWLLSDGEGRRIAAVEANDSGTRMNDGRCDPLGRFWAGTMAYDDTPGRGSLYRLDVDGAVSRVLSDVTTSNGIDWTADGESMLYVDSATRRIDVFDFDPLRGIPRHRRPLVDIPSNDGVPDGLVVDDEGGVWVALWDGSAVRRYLPANGDLDIEVRLPARRVTSCTFGGADLADLYITTAWQGLTQSERASEPHAGSLFRVRPGVKGIPARRFQG